MYQWVFGQWRLVRGKDGCRPMIPRTMSSRGQRCVLHRLEALRA